MESTKVKSTVVSVEDTESYEKSQADLAAEDPKEETAKAWFEDESA